jgi:hypothetical protein
MKTFEYWLIDSTKSLHSKMNPKDKEEMNTSNLKNLSDLQKYFITGAVLCTMEKYRIKYEKYANSASMIINTPCAWGHVLGYDINKEFIDTHDECAWFSKYVEPLLDVELIKEWQDANIN